MTACLPGWPRSAAVRAAAARKLSGRPTRSSAPVENHRESLFVGKHVLPELGAQRRQPLADRGQPRLLLGREPGAGANEHRAVAIEHARGLRVERQPRLRPMQRFDALEQRVVEKNGAALARQDRRDFALDLLQRVVAVGADEVEEHRGDAVERLAAALQRADRIVERRHLCIAGDRIDLGALLRQRRVERRAEMFGRDARERRRAERAGPGFEKGIARGGGTRVHGAVLGLGFGSARIGSISPASGQPGRASAGNRAPSPLAGEGGPTKSGRMRGRAARRVGLALAGSRWFVSNKSSRIAAILTKAPIGATPHPSRFA